jgi:3-hydroxyacyl-CoA dehydrogenase/enoyl-CoA hydratase/3-hydroxybutyryl-CoA epimerase
MTGAFSLEDAGDGAAILRFDSPGRKVNVFTREALGELDQLVRALAERHDLRLLVLASAKPGVFIAGADVGEIENVTDPTVAEAGTRYGQRLFSAWAALPFPTVAAIDGTCLGGGTEIALASSWIFVSDRPELRIGLPEVQLGIVPGWGGCTRLPRRIGLVAALGLILPGQPVVGRRALALGLADEILPEAGFLDRALALARSRIGVAPPRRGPRGLRGALIDANPLGRAVVLARARRQLLARTRGRYPAPLRALEVVRRGLAGGEGDGLEAEARANRELAVAPVTKSLIHVFRLVERSKKSGRDEEAARIRRPAVVGAGVMGGGIAALVAERTGLPVRLKDVRPEAISTALAHAAALFDRSGAKRRLPAAEGRRKLALLQPTLDEDGLGACDLVVEAIVEELGAKQRLFAELARRCPGAILATNTSSLSVDAIGASVAERERVVGLHFFNPVERMPLVEVVAGPRTAPASVAVVAAFARRLGKTPVVVRDGPGFLVNRLLAFYSAAALRLLDDGHAVEAIDGALVEWGFPMGPLRLADEVGLDVSAKVARILSVAFPDRLRFPAWVERLGGDGRLGVKSGGGVYRYAGRRARGVDPAVYELVGRRPSARRRRGADDGLAERMVLPMVDEAARCLAEGVVADPGALDLAMIFGTGFPPFRGGLCRWADSVGLGEVASRLASLGIPPSDALARFAAAGGFYAAYPPIR